MNNEEAVIDAIAKMNGVLDMEYVTPGMIQGALREFFAVIEEGNDAACYEQKVRDLEGAVQDLQGRVSGLENALMRQAKVNVKNNCKK